MRCSPSYLSFASLLETSVSDSKAQVIGDGAIAQGDGAKAVGQGGIMIEGGMNGSYLVVGNNNIVNSDEKKKKKK